MMLGDCIFMDIYGLKVSDVREAICTIFSKFPNLKLAFELPTQTVSLILILEHKYCVLPTGKPI